MDVIRIEVKCNQHCLFCGADPTNKDDYTLDFNALKAIVDKAGERELIEVSGGEPTLSPLLPKLLLYAKKQGKTVSLQTNAMRFHDAKVTAALVKAGLLRAFVSLHAPEAKLNDALTRTKGGFELSLLGIDNLLKAGVHVSLNMVVCRANYKKQGAYARFIAARFPQVQTIVFSFVNPFHQAWRYRRMIPKISDVMPHMKEALEQGEALGLDCHVPDICGIPLCFLQGYERFADKFELIQKGAPFSPHRDKAKAHACRLCKWDAKCDGLWKRYIELYGTDELSPVDGEQEEKTSAKAARPQMKARKVGETKRMKDTALLIGVDCQNDCIFCSEGGRSASASKMTLEEAETLLTETKPDWVFLSGREPTSAPDFFRFLALAKQSSAKEITLVTNGAGLADFAFAEKLLQGGVTEIRISIHGRNAKQHDALTRRAGSFHDIERAVENLNHLKSTYDFQTLALVVVNRKNMERLPEIVKQLEYLRFDKIGLGIIEPSGNALKHFDALVPRYSEAAAYIEALFEEIEKEMLDIYVDSLPPCLLDDPEKIPLGLRSEIETLDSETGALIRMEAMREKVFGEVCKPCKYRNRCEGVWKGYVERFGFDEFGMD